jgi:protein SCO1
MIAFGTPASRRRLLITLAVSCLAVAGPLRAEDPPLPFGGPFSLKTHDGRDVTDRSFADQFLLIYFGYTNCPDVCPTDLLEMQQTLETLGARGRVVQPLFITIDPARDTAEKLALYVQGFHPRLLGLTGSEAQVAAAAKAYRVHRRKAQGAGDDYTVDHSANLYFVGPDGRFLTLFPAGTNAGAMAAVMKRYLP